MAAEINRALREATDGMLRITSAWQEYKQNVSARSGELGGYVTSLEYMANDVQRALPIAGPARGTLEDVNRRMRNLASALRELQGRLPSNPDGQRWPSRPPGKLPSARLSEDLRMAINNTANISRLFSELMGTVRDLSLTLRKDVYVLESLAGEISMIPQAAHMAVRIRGVVQSLSEMRSILAKID